MYTILLEHNTCLLTRQVYENPGNYVVELC
ncbi:UNVERIFIED_ORG: hypothetical protein FHU01_1908 [Citrobacter freundii]